MVCVFFFFLFCFVCFFLARLDTFIHSDSHSFISALIYLYMSVCFHFSPLNLATLFVTPRL